jgi:hypothetical protein
MTMMKRIGILVAAVVIGALGLGVSERVASPGGQGLVASAEARVGRPMTPASVAGVARRTARRCAAGVYYC